jgi:hypothetical protein
MAIASSVSKSGPYACNGVTTAFAIGFFCQAPTDVGVVRTDASGADTSLIYGTDYSVSLNSDQVASPGGTATLTAAPATGFQITLLRNVALTQGTSLPNQGGWYPKVVENALDKLTMGLQQLAEKVSRSVILGVTQTDPTALINAINTNAALAAASATSATASAGAASASASIAAAAAAIASMGMKRAPVAGGVLSSPNGYYAFMANAAYVLPDFTGIDTFGLASLSNSAAVPATVQTADGWTLAPGLTAGTFKAVAPSSSATPHGTWGTVSQTPPIVSAVTAAGAPTVVGSVQLSATLAVLLYGVGGTALYAAAFNPLTGSFGAPILIPTSAGVAGHIYADSATTFVVGFAQSGAPAVIAGSVSALTISFGSPAAGTYGYQLLIQLAQGLYVHSYGNGGAEAFSVSGTVVAKGNNIIPGGMSNGAIARVSATTFLMVGFSTVASPAALVAAIGTVTGNTTAFAANVTASTTILAGSTALRFLRSLAAGGPFIACAQNNSPSTTGAFYGITVSGTTPTIGVVLALANTLPAQIIPSTYISPPATDPAQALLGYSSTQLLMGISTGAVALSISGTTLTGGATFGSAPTKFVNDVSTGANCYAVTGTTVDKITVSGATISSTYQMAVSPVVVASDTLNDKAVNYGSTWYAWTLPTIACAVTTNKWLAISGSTINLYGPIA